MITLQGLYEYAVPAWQTRPRPAELKDFDVKAFGKSVAPRPLNPSNKESHIYSNTSKLNGQDVPRFVLYRRRKDYSACSGKRMLYLRHANNSLISIVASIGLVKCILEAVKRDQMHHMLGQL